MISFDKAKVLKSRELNFGQFGFNVLSNNSVFDLNYSLQQSSILGLWIPLLNYKDKNLTLITQKEFNNLNASSLKEKFKITINDVQFSNLLNSNNIDYGKEIGKDLFYDKAVDGLENQYFRTELAKIVTFNTYSKNKENSSRLYNYNSNENIFNLGNLTDEGYMPEIIIFNRALGSEEKLKIETYLALKYGITLYNKGNYLSPLNKYLWNNSSKSTDETFKNRITGIAKSNISGLDIPKSVTHYEEAGGSTKTSGNINNYSDDGSTGNVNNPNRLLLMSVVSNLPSPTLTIDYTPNKLINTEYLLPGGTFISTKTTSTTNPSSGYISTKSINSNGNYFTFRVAKGGTNYIIGLNESDVTTNRKAIKYSLIIDKELKVALSDGVGKKLTTQPAIFNNLTVTEDTIIKIGIEGNNIVYTIPLISGGSATHSVTRTSPNPLYIDYYMESSNMEIRDLAINSQADANYNNRIIGDKYSITTSKAIKLSGRQITASDVNARGVITPAKSFVDNNFQITFKTTNNGADVGLINNIADLTAADKINFRVNISNTGAVSIIEGKRTIKVERRVKKWIIWPIWYTWETQVKNELVSNSYKTNYIARANSEIKIIKQGNSIKYYFEGTKLPYETVLTSPTILQPCFFLASKQMMIRDLRINSESSKLKDESYLLWGDNNEAANILVKDETKNLYKMLRSWKVIPTNFINANATEGSINEADKIPVTIELSSVGVDAKTTNILNKLYKGSSGEANRKQFLIIDKSGTGEFKPGDIRTVEQTGYNLRNGDEKLWFENVKFDIDNSGSDVFSFGYADENQILPLSLSKSHLSANSCMAPKEYVEFWVDDYTNLNDSKTKEPFAYKLYDEANPNNIISSETNLKLSEISLNSPKKVKGLNSQNTYKLEVTDADGNLVQSQITFQQYSGFVENGKKLLSDYTDTILEDGKTIMLDASKNIIASEKSSMSYKWYKLNKDSNYLPIDTSDSRNKGAISINSEGTYKVVATNKKGCLSTDIVTLSKTAVNKLTPIYPIATGKSFEVRFNSIISEFNNNNTISIFNSMNQLVHTQKIKLNATNYQTIEINPSSTLPPGVYYLFLQVGSTDNKENIERVSFIIQ